MENRIALLGIIVENKEVTDRLNDILHEYADYVVGRMGIPYRERGISIISVVLDAPESAVSALSGKLGMLEGVSVKAVYSKATGTSTLPHSPMLRMRSWPLCWRICWCGRIFRRSIRRRMLSEGRRWAIPFISAPCWNFPTIAGGGAGIAG